MPFIHGLYTGCTPHGGQAVRAPARTRTRAHAHLDLPEVGEQLLLQSHHALRRMRTHKARTAAAQAGPHIAPASSASHLHIGYSCSDGQEELLGR